jgi:hypothetical protein
MSQRVAAGDHKARVVWNLFGTNHIIHTSSAKRTTHKAELEFPSPKRNRVRGWGIPESCDALHMKVITNQIHPKRKTVRKGGEGMMSAWAKCDEEMYHKKHQSVSLMIGEKQ